jgi:hypothetical protein
MQAYFIQAASTGSLSQTSGVQVHASQTWLKSSGFANNVLRFRLTGSANAYNDEMVLKVNPLFDPGGSQKFWSMYAEAPEVYVIKNGSNYSITRLPSVDDQTILTVGVKAGVLANYALNVTGTETFYCAKGIFIEDLKTGATQDLKSNPVYSFSAGPSDPPGRFRIHFTGPYGIADHSDTNPVNIFTSGKILTIRSNTPIPADSEMILYNLLGQRIMQQKIQGYFTSICLNIPAGYYLVKLAGKDMTCSQKVFVR